MSSVVSQSVLAKINVTRSIFEHESRAKEIEGDSACCVARNYITVISALTTSDAALECRRSKKSLRYAHRKFILQTKLFVSADQFRSSKK